MNWRPSLPVVVVAYGTGYALTRRSPPLGGAGVMEFLLTFALVWVAQPMVLSLVAVVVYRIFNFLLPAIPALLVYDEVEPLIAAGNT